MAQLQSERSESLESYACAAFYSSEAMEKYVTEKRGWRNECELWMRIRNGKFDRTCTAGAYEKNEILFPVHFLLLLAGWLAGE